MSITLYLRSLLILLTLVLTGCANLGAIQEFGKISADSAGYSKLTDQYVQGPESQKRHTLENESAQRDILTNQSADRSPQSAQLAIFHKTLSNYMGSLADLAADEVLVYDTEVDGLVDAAVAGKLIADDKASVVKSITKLLADAATNAYRQRELKQVIERGNAPLQNVLADMVRIMAAFDSSIENDRAAYNRYYRTLMATARNNNREPIAAELIWASNADVIKDFDARKKAIPAYVETLKTISAAHQSLYDNRDKISDKEVLAQLKRYTKKIRAAYALSRDLEKK